MRGNEIANETEENTEGRKSREREREEEADMTGLSAGDAVKVLFALEWAATHFISPAFSLSQSIHPSPCLPVNFKWRRIEKKTLKGE